MFRRKKIDGGLLMEYALQDVVKNPRDYHQFAGVVRAIALKIGLNDEDRDKIFGALAEKIQEWKQQKTND